MADIYPFRGIRFDPDRVDLGRVLCPPYDAVSAEEARDLRKEPLNAIHLELPEGDARARYRNSARAWKAWRERGILVRDEAPCFYVCEQKFNLDGRRLRRIGFFAAMGVSSAAAKAVIRHEKTLSKPKADRLRLLKTVRANLSPIFGIFPDPAAKVRRALARARRAKPLAQGRAASGVYCRLWRVSDPRTTSLIRGALRSRRVLIADGHHRYEVSRRYHALKRSRESSTVLIYLCPEEDAGLVVLPTHRVVGKDGLMERALERAKASRCRTLEDCLRRLAASRNPYAFGLVASYSQRRRPFAGSAALASNAGLGQAHRAAWLLEPAENDGCRSGLCVEWLSMNLLRDVPPEQIRYTPDARAAARWAKLSGGAALLVKPMRVGQIRRAVDAVGLLPQKTTYFYPKIATGLVFKATG